MTEHAGGAGVISLLSAAKINPQGFMQRLIAGITGYVDGSCDKTSDALRVTVCTEVDPSRFLEVKERLIIAVAAARNSKLVSATLSGVERTGVEGELQLIGLKPLLNDHLVDKDGKKEREPGLYLITYVGRNKHQYHVRTVPPLVQEKNDCVA